MSPNNWLDDGLKRWAREEPQRVALSDGLNEKITYGDLERVTAEMSESLERAGVGPHDVVALFKSHGLSLALSILTLMRKGLSGIVLESQIPRDQVAQLCREFPITAVWCDANARISSENIQATALFRMGPTFSLFKMSGGGIEHPCWLLLTSGSSGQRKAVRIGFDELGRRAESESEYFKISAQSHSLSSLLYSHDVGLTQLLSHVVSGAKVTVHPFVFPSMVWNVLRGNGITSVWGSPYLWRKLIEICPHGELLSETVEFVTVSGGSLLVSELAMLQEKLPNARIARTFGQTETFRSFMSFDADEGFETIVPGVNVHLDGEGQLYHSGEGKMLGYLGESDSSEPIATGDYFEVVQGRYCFRGRRDDMIKRYDQRFFAAEVENLIQTLEPVIDCYVFQGDEEDVDPDLCACISTHAPPGEVRRLVHALCRSQLSLYKTPNKYFVSREFPKLANGKVDKVRLRAMTTSNA